MGLTDRAISGRGSIMAVDYSKLWKLLIDKKMNKSQLGKKAHISTNAVAKLGKNETVSLETLEKICIALDCNIDDIMDFVPLAEEMSNNELS